MATSLSPGEAATLDVALGYFAEGSAARSLERVLADSILFDTSERAVEVPWVAANLAGAESVVDIGFTMSSLDMLGLLLHCHASGMRVEGFDLISPRDVLRRYPEDWRDQILDVPVHVGDFLTSGESTGADAASSFAVLTCISTLEHFGFDHPGSVGGGVFARAWSAGDVDRHRAEDVEARFFNACRRLLQSNGCILLSVPMGSGGPVLVQDSLGLWTAQWEYEIESWNRLKSQPGWSVEEERFFRDGHGRWMEVDGPHALADVSSLGRPHAAGCALLRLRRTAASPL